MTQTTGSTYRIEKIQWEKRQIPETAYYGIQTLRAMEIFR
jgi:aspartate ammonia-lyase